MLAEYAPVEESYYLGKIVGMDLRHRRLPSTHSDKGLVNQPGTSQSAARFQPLPDTISSGDSDDNMDPPKFKLEK